MNLYQIQKKKTHKHKHKLRNNASWAKTRVENAEIEAYLRAILR